MIAMQLILVQSKHVRHHDQWKLKDLVTLIQALSNALTACTQDATALGLQVTKSLSYPGLGGLIICMVIVCNELSPVVDYQPLIFIKVVTLA